MSSTPNPAPIHEYVYMCVHMFVYACVIQREAQWSSDAINTEPSAYKRICKYMCAYVCICVFNTARSTREQWCHQHRNPANIQQYVYTYMCVHVCTCACNTARGRIVQQCHHPRTQRLYLCCSVLQRVAACCSVLQRVAVCCSGGATNRGSSAYTWTCVYVYVYTYIEYVYAYVCNLARGLIEEQCSLQ